MPKKIKGTWYTKYDLFLNGRWNPNAELSTSSVTFSFKYMNCSSLLSVLGIQDYKNKLEIANEQVIMDNKGKPIFHYKNGPAITFDDGTKIWAQNGLLHRVDGPVIQNDFFDVPNLWCLNGMVHRINGPANGTRWFLFGEDINGATRLKKWAKENGINLFNMSEEDKVFFYMKWMN